MISILSLSLLTVMAGAAVAPALGVIKEAFPNASQLSIQLIISMPALFIFLTNMVFPRLSAKFGAKTLVLAGLVLYTVGGVAAGLFSNIVLLLCMRALVGIGVGIIMPLSTGLLAYYYPPEAQSKLSGYSSAMNQIGGVVGTLLGSALIGFANGAGVPFVISQGSMRAGKSAASTVMPLVSAALYLSQFVSPFLMSGATALLGSLRHPAYLFGMILSVLFLLWSLTIRVIVPKPLELAAELEEQKASRS